jgi:protein-S-isoprenylcysteine O-methyltransferase Ste14
MRLILITILTLLATALLVPFIFMHRGTPSLDIIPLCWLVLLLYWWVTAFRAKAIVERQSLNSALAHRIPVFIAWILLAARGLPYPMNIRLVPYAEWVFFLGLAICVAGTFYALWARHTLAGNWSGDVTFKQGHELVRTGPYRFTRHPIYTGLLAMCLGTALAIGTVRGFLALLILTTAFWIKLRQEERLMMQHFPDQYPAYRKEVKALVPFVI